MSFPLTVNSRLSDTPSTVAVTVAVLLLAEEIPPASLALTIPFESTVRTLSSDELQRTFCEFEPAGTISVSLTIVESPSVSSVLSAVRLNFSISRLCTIVNVIESLIDALRR